MAEKNYKIIMEKLKELGTAQNRKVFAKHGVGKDFYGVSFANLEILRKEIKRDHALAMKLWGSGNTDARFLATMIADPSQLSPDQLEEWLDDIDFHILTVLFVKNIVSKSDFAKSKLEKWIRSDDEITGQAGWNILANIALDSNDLSDGYLSDLISKIEKDIHSSKNRTRYSMNNALISIGIRNENLEKLATEAARRIGKVEVDHGDTSCKTPDAVEYIKKARKRKKK